MVTAREPQTIAQTLIQQYGQTFAAELYVEIEKNSTAPLFQLLCGAILFSARIPPPWR